MYLSYRKPEDNGNFHVPLEISMYVLLSKVRRYTEMSMHPFLSQKVH